MTIATKQPGRQQTASGRPKTDRPPGTIMAVATVALLTILSVIGWSNPASAHEGHGTELADPSTSSSEETLTRMQATMTRATIAEFHLWANDDLRTFRPTKIEGLDLIGNGGRTRAPDVDCFVDFDDDLTIGTYMADGAEDTFYDSPWYQKCFDSYHPAVAVKPTVYSHFHLGYEDSRIGPCSGDTTDWGRKADPFPSDNDDIGTWVNSPCESEIDPVTEPRSGISPHTPGEVAQILAYDGDGYLPFQLRTLKVVSGEVEVCRLPAGPYEAAGPGGSPWQCSTLGAGYFNMSNVVPNAIEVRIEFLTNGSEIDNIGIDLL